jgi:putative ABC transport system ATP-binding protein
MGELCAVDLSVSYDGTPALHPLALRVRPGELLAVTGASGAGKSSLLWALAGAVRPASGAVTVDGERIGSREDAARRGVVIVPQGNGLASSLTAVENVVVPLLAAGVPAPEARRRAEEALLRFGLDDVGSHLVEELSGGQQQRAALARGLAARGSVVLADEPTSELDGDNREIAVAALRAEAARGAAVVLATHDPDAAAAADAELHLDAGVAIWIRVAGDGEGDLDGDVGGDVDGDVGGDVGGDVAG